EDGIRAYKVTGVQTCALPISIGSAVMKAGNAGLGAVHSLAHPLSSIAGLHHGTTNGILLPHVLEFNRMSCEDRLRDLALAMDLRSEERRVGKDCRLRGLR